MRYPRSTRKANKNVFDAVVMRMPFHVVAHYVSGSETPQKTARFVIRLSK